MVIVPPILINPFFIAAAAISGWQHVRMQRASVVRNPQFAMMVFCPAMMVITLLNGRDNANHHPNPWVSLAMLLIGVAALTFTWRQNRLVPPRQRIR
jgi:hypothetical protein